MPRQPDSTAGSSTPDKVFQMDPETLGGNVLGTLLENVLFLKKGFVWFSF